jgi:hypothetical protein
MTNMQTLIILLTNFKTWQHFGTVKNTINFKNNLNKKI